MWTSFNPAAGARACSLGKASQWPQVFPGEHPVFTKMLGQQYNPDVHWYSQIPPGMFSSTCGLSWTVLGPWACGWCCKCSNLHHANMGRNGVPILFPPSATPSQKYSSRSSRGEVVTSFGSTQGMSWSGKGGSGNLSVKVLEADKSLTGSYKSMFQKLTDIREGDPHASSHTPGYRNIWENLE